MEQRPLRLGDLVDDYCPRERRVTNHAIVAVVGESIKQTRCTTCDTEHAYKGGQAPKRRKKDPTGDLYQEVLSNAGGQLVGPSNGQSQPSPENPDIRGAASTNGGDAPKAPAESGGEITMNGNGAEPASGPDEVWAGHRPLIRATLPRNENEQPPPRPIPEFTMHQRHGRGAFRQGAWPQRGGPNGNGNGFRGPGGRPGAGPGAGAGQGRRRRGRRRPK